MNRRGNCHDNAVAESFSASAANSVKGLEVSDLLIFFNF